MRIEIENANEVARALAQYGAKAERLISDAVNATALEINGDVKRAIQRGPKTGVVYEKSNPNRRHVASAPGEAPATDTGALVSSLYFTREPPLTATIGSRLPYAYYLEFGAINMAPRPSWLPAIEENRPKFNKRLDAALRRAAE